MPLVYYGYRWAWIHSHTQWGRKASLMMVWSQTWAVGLHDPPFFSVHFCRIGSLMVILYQRFHCNVPHILGLRNPTHRSMSPPTQSCTAYIASESILNNQCPFWVPSVAICICSTIICECPNHRCLCLFCHYLLMFCCHLLMSWLPPSAYNLLPSTCYGWSDGDRSSRRYWWEER
jgi:hypothetical protein